MLSQLVKQGVILLLKPREEEVAFNFKSLCCQRHEQHIKSLLRQLHNHVQAYVNITQPFDYLSDTAVSSLTVYEE